MDSRKFRKHLEAISPQGLAFSQALGRTVAALDEGALADVPDLLGDASDGEFEFLDFSDDDVGFAKGWAPIAVVGSKGAEGPILQTEGLLLARSARGKLVELLLLDVGGTLVPGSEQRVGKSLGALKLRACRAAIEEKPRAEAERKSKLAPRPPPPRQSPARPNSDAQDWWAGLDRHGKWRKELARAIDLSEDATPADHQLDQLLAAESIVVYVAGGVLDLEPLRQFRRLRELSLEGHDGFTNLPILYELPSLRRLWLRKDNLADLSFLEKLTALESLDLAQNRLADLSPLAKLTRLRELNLGHNLISDLRPLASLIDLAKLDIGYNQISDLLPLAGLTALEELRANDNQYVDLAPLANLTKLVTLDVGGPFGAGKVTSLAPLAGLTRLERLDISNNEKIADLSSLAGCVRLESLVCNVMASALSFQPLLGLESLRRISSHPAIMVKKDRDAFKKARPKVVLALS